ncbi:hypothetical protein ADUPG1_009782 [Aduncisulcus paluster]|uniref:Cilia- and flagella-associated protein 157 n=1 Tax=Aduncisulcus paluster TaxID=2918883 RepID=A0ABQ5KZH4_9EUKA|nr:hypothetical protein ADUPG1_009782 [Aduncisulcus paluster]
MERIKELESEFNEAVIKENRDIRQRLDVVLKEKEELKLESYERIKSLEEKIKSAKQAGVDEQKQVTMRIMKENMNLKKQLEQSNLSFNSLEKRNHELETLVTGSKAGQCRYEDLKETLAEVRKRLVEKEKTMKELHRVYFARMAQERTLIRKIAAEEIVKARETLLAAVSKHITSVTGTTLEESVRLSEEADKSSRIAAMAKQEASILRQKNLDLQKKYSTSEARMNELNRKLAAERRVRSRLVEILRSVCGIDSRTMQDNIEKLQKYVHSKLPTKYQHIFLPSSSSSSSSEIPKQPSECEDSIKRNSSSSTSPCVHNTSSIPTAPINDGLLYPLHEKLMATAQKLSLIQLPYSSKLPDFITSNPFAPPGLSQQQIHPLDAEKERIKKLFQPKQPKIYASPSPAFMYAPFETEIPTGPYIAMCNRQLVERACNVVGEMPVTLQRIVLRAMAQGNISLIRDVQAKLARDLLLQCEDGSCEAGILKSTHSGPASSSSVPTEKKSPEKKAPEITFPSRVTDDAMCRTTLVPRALSIPISTLPTQQQAALHVGIVQLTDMLAIVKDESLHDDMEKLRVKRNVAKAAVSLRKVLCDIIGAESCCDCVCHIADGIRDDHDHTSRSTAKSSSKLSSSQPMNENDLFLAPSSTLTPNICPVCGCGIGKPKEVSPPPFPLICATRALLHDGRLLQYSIYGESDDKNRFSSTSENRIEDVSISNGEFKSNKKQGFKSSTQGRTPISKDPYSRDSKRSLFSNRGMKESPGFVKPSSFSRRIKTSSFHSSQIHQSSSTAANRLATSTGLAQSKLKKLRPTIIPPLK